MFAVPARRGGCERNTHKAARTLLAVCAACSLTLCGTGAFAAAPEQDIAQLVMALQQEGQDAAQKASYTGGDYRLSLTKAAAQTEDAAETPAPQADEEEPVTLADPGETTQPQQHSIHDENGFYVHNQQSTYNSLTKDGLWVGGTNDNEGFYVDNDGNVTTTGTASFKQGADMGGHKITGVAAGIEDTDAVNVGQLKSTISGAYQAGNGLELKDDADPATDTKVFSIKLKEGENNLSVDENGLGLKNNVILSGEDGNSVNINGADGTITVKNGNGEGAASIEIGNGTITGLTSSDWNTFTSDVNAGRVATEGELKILSEHSVLYDVNENGEVQYGSITLKGTTPYAGKEGGGTSITNVAYANGADGSAAVNVDLLNDTVTTATETMKANDQHLVTNQEAGGNGNYTVNKTDDTVTLKVAKGDGTYTDVVIDDVASAEELGNVGDLNADLKQTGQAVTVIGAVNTVDNKVEGVKTSLGDLNYVTGEAGATGNAVTNGDTITASIGKLDAAIGDVTAEAGKHSTVTAATGGNITVTKTPATDTTGAKYEVSLNSDLTDLNSVSAGTITATGAISAGDIHINASGTEGTITGLTNTQWGEGHTVVADRAATEGQLQTVANAEDYVTDGSINNTDGTLTLNRVQGGAITISGLSDYVASVNDYVTGGSIDTESGNITLNRQLGGSVTISGLEDYVSGLDTYVTGASIDGTELTITQNHGNAISVDLNGLTGELSTTDYQLVANPSGGNYKVENGKVDLTVQNGDDTGDRKTVTIEGVASTADVNKAQTEAKKHSTVTAGDNINVTTTEATDTEGAKYKVSLNPELSGLTSVTATGAISAGDIHINASGTEGTITGLTNTQWGEGHTVVADRAATEGQLQTVANAEDYVTDGSINNTDGTLTLNRVQGGAITISGLSDYVASVNDYVTGGSIDTESGNITLNRQLGGSVTISGLEDYVSGLDTYVTGASIDGTELTITQNHGNAISVDLNGLTGELSTTDYQLVANPSGGNYKVENGKVDLTVQNGDDTGDRKTVTIEGVASTADVNKAQTEAKKHSTVTAGDNINVTTTEATDTAGAKYEVSLNPELSGLTSVEASGNVKAGSFSAGGITINGTETVGTITGLTNTQWGEGHTVVANQAATEGQLAAVQSQIKTYTDGDGIDITAGQDGADSTISVDAGKGLTMDGTDGDKQLIVNAGAGLGFDTKNGNALKVNTGDGLTIKDDGSVAVKLVESGSGLDLSADGLKVNTGNGLKIDETSNALTITLAENSNLSLEGSGLSLAQALTGLTSIETGTLTASGAGSFGSLTVGKNDNEGVEGISITGTKITGLVTGDIKNDSDAVNKEYVDKFLDTDKGLAVQYNNASKTTVTLGDLNNEVKTRVTNLENARLNEDSTDAVAGNQLWETNQKVGDATWNGTNYLDGNDDEQISLTEAAEILDSAIGENQYTGQGVLEQNLNGESYSSITETISTMDLKIGNLTFGNQDVLQGPQSSVTHALDLLNQAVGAVNFDEGVSFIGKGTDLTNAVRSLDSNLSAISSVIGVRVKDDGGLTTTIDWEGSSIPDETSLVGAIKNVDNRVTALEEIHAGELNIQSLSAFSKMSAANVSTLSALSTMDAATANALAGMSAEDAAALAETAGVPAANASPEPTADTTGDNSKRGPEDGTETATSYDGTTTKVDSDLHVTGNTQMDGTLTVNDAGQFNNGLTVGTKKEGGTALTVNGGASITGTLNMNDNKITGVKDGDISADSTEAINGSQLYETQQMISGNSAAIASLGGQVSRLDNRIDRVGAGAAALAALHPLDYDPEVKWDFAAGYGNYRGANAVAVGAFYRPNEDVMFSVGGSMGGGENMVNAGVSFKLGSGGSGLTTSRTAMARELAAMKETVAAQNAQIEQQAAQIAELTALVQQLAAEKAEAPAAED